MIRMNKYCWEEHMILRFLFSEKYIKLSFVLAQGHRRNNLVGIGIFLFLKVIAYQYNTLDEAISHTHTHAHTNAHTNIYIYIYIYIRFQGHWVLQNIKET